MKKLYSPKVGINMVIDSRTSTHPMVLEDKKSRLCPKAVLPEKDKYPPYPLCELTGFRIDNQGDISSPNGLRRPPSCPIMDQTDKYCRIKENRSAFISQYLK